MKENRAQQNVVKVIILACVTHRQNRRYTIPMISWPAATLAMITRDYYENQANGVERIYIVHTDKTCHLNELTGKSTY